VKEVSGRKTDGGGDVSANGTVTADGEVVAVPAPEEHGRRGLTIPLLRPTGGVLTLS